MFDELDIINKTLSKESQPNQRRIIKILNNENKYEQDCLMSKDLKKILNKDKINSILKKETTKCDFSKIRNNSSINIFRKKISKSILNRNENSLHPKKINSLILSNSNQTTTRLLDRKTINGLPVTFPLYLSHNRTFSSIGEKNRIEKIISKLVCLKTYILKDNLNKFNIIKEFLWKNGFKDKKYFKQNAINNLYHYLLKPFSFPNEYILADIINEGINYKSPQALDASKKQGEINILEHIKENQNLEEIQKMNIKTRNKNQDLKVKNNNIFRKYTTLILKSKAYMNKSLSVLIQDLESEIKQIILKKSDKLEEYNNSFIKKQEIIKNIDKNKYIPNLCLLSQGFKEKCQINIDKKNKKIIKYINKQNYLKKINNRLFYNTIKKNKSEIFDRDEIQKNSKLTEYIVMERAKKYLLENPNNYNLTIFEKIKQNKYNSKL